MLAPLLPLLWYVIFFHQRKLQLLFPSLVLVIGLSPLLAPTAGSFVADAFGWRYVFATLAAIALIVLLLVLFFLPEGQKPDKSVSLKTQANNCHFQKHLTASTVLYFYVGRFIFFCWFVCICGRLAINFYGRLSCNFKTVWWHLCIIICRLNWLQPVQSFAYKKI